MKRLFGIILIFALGLSLCACVRNAGHAPSPEPETEASDLPHDESGDVSAFDPDTDTDNRFILPYYGCVAETDDVYYWLPSNRQYLLYYDKLTGDMEPLCGRPECEHIQGGRNGEPNRACDSYLNAEACSLSLYRGKLYYVSDDSEKGGPPWYSLWRMGPDGTQKEEVLVLEPPEDSRPQTYILHRGMLYSFCFDSIVVAGENRCRARYIVTPIDGESCDYTVMYERESHYAQLGYMRFIGQYCYIFNCYTDEETQQNRTSVLRWNSVTSETELLGDGPEIGRCYEPWVTRDGEIFAAGEDQNIHRLEDGVWEEYIDFSDDDGNFEAKSISDGVMIGLRGPGPDQQILKDYEIWIRRFDGTTLYKGPLPQQWREAIPAADDAQSSLAFIEGGEGSLLAMFSAVWPDPSGVTGRTVCAFLVQYEITPDGLVEKPLGSSRPDLAPIN